MGFTVSVTYPADAKFKMDYYTSSHMPMVAEEFKDFGFKGYQVSENLTTPDPNSPAPSSVLCLLFFNDAEGFQKALQEKGEKVLGDIPNFSDKNPLLMGGTNVASTVSV